MARLKEQSRVERERRHLEKATKRKLQEEEEAHPKKSRTVEAPVFTVSDNSEGEVEEVFGDPDEKSDGTPPSHASSKRSRSISRQSHEVYTYNKKIYNYTKYFKFFSFLLCFYTEMTKFFCKICSGIHMNVKSGNLSNI